jgi:glycosyltransferase involved in cell wall biosynthesis
MINILIDLGKLKNRNSGLGEVSYGLATALAARHSTLQNLGIQLYFLVPPTYINHWGDGVKYVSNGYINKLLKINFPTIHVWHALHQDSDFMPDTSSHYILTVHDLNVAWHHNKQTALKRLRKIQKKIDRAQTLTAISKFTAQKMKELMSIKDMPISIIYNGIEAFEKATKPHGILTTDPFFFHISSLLAKKNVSVLIDMMSKWPEEKMVIAGNWKGEYALKMLKSIKSYDLSNIIVLPEVTQAEKAWLYQHCKAFFFPSLLEGFGLPLLEAMQAGKPVFSSTCTSLPEIGGTHAFYWDHFDPHYMKKTVETGLELAHSNLTFSNHQQAYAASFTWNKAADEYILLYRDAARRSDII